MESILEQEFGYNRLELYSTTFYKKNNTKVEGYVLTYLTPAFEENAMDCNNSEYYLDLEEAKKAFTDRANSANPFNKNQSYDWDKYDEFQQGLK